MASTIIHYAISKRISENIDVKDRERFLFGATIVPDASSHEDGSYDQAHCQSWSSDCLKKGIDWNLFEQRYCDDFDTDSIYLGYWCHLVQDSMWFHDIVDKHVRIYPREIRNKYYQKGYADYIKLNYLISKEYNLEIPSFSRLNIPIKEVKADVIQTRLNGFYEQFNSVECTKNDLELYKWNIIANYIDKCFEFCIQEIDAMKNGGIRVKPSVYYVMA